MTLRSVRRPNVTYFLLRRVSLRNEGKFHPMRPRLYSSETQRRNIPAAISAGDPQCRVALAAHTIAHSHNNSCLRSTHTDASFHAACSKPVHSKSALPSRPCPKHRHPEVHQDWLHRSKARVSSSTLHAPKNCTAPSPYSATSHATRLQFPTVHPSKTGAPQGQIACLLHLHGAPPAAEPARLCL